MPLKPLPDKYEFAEEERIVLDYWNKNEVFKQSLERSKKKPRFSFYDGPPFATGMPHYGHILAGTIKDIVTRWAAMNGYYVERRFGWDCHGLPVEYEIDKKLNIKSPDDVKKMGIDKYNAECRGIVMTYSEEWEMIVKRLGRWIDFENDYKTMYPSFMESVWWVFKQLFQKGLVYRGFKVMPFSTGCSTPLSNFEAGQNYKDVRDPAVVISFPILTGPETGTSLLAWTTTPWTLPSNLSLCVNPTEVYVKIKDKKHDMYVIMMEKRISSVYKEAQYEPTGTKYLGKELVGWTYEPLFNYFIYKREEGGAFRVLCDNYVTDSSGTGVVHQAPYFGEDDYRVCLEAGIIKRDGQIVCPVDAVGRFTEDVTDFAGQYVKEADTEIMKNLKQRGRLIDRQMCSHNYPYCWRSDTPLIYKAVPSWFVRVEQMIPDLLENNAKTYWVPDYVKEKRFANWLRDARDWAVSRNRYWGTPLPIWMSEDGQETICVGSIAELEKLTGQKITDIHRESVDQLTIPSRCGKGVLKRVTEVFDCWFESGSMPYAQQHYPFERKKEFEDSFPADFIAEGIDQTRGWFYTLLVLSTALFGEPPFKNLIANGLILASDGAKMSKRKKNYPEPSLVIDKFGADAVRLYLINSPAVRGDSLKFIEDGVKDVLKDVLLPWYNAYRFLIQNIFRWEQESGEVFQFDEENWVIDDTFNYMDRWILSFTQSLIKFVRQEMAAYRLYTVVPRLCKFVDYLTNWYVRTNRLRLKGVISPEDEQASLQTLFIVIYSMMKVMASFTPFLVENFYTNLRTCLKGYDESKVDSIHFLDVPQPREELISSEIEIAVSRMQSVIELARTLRDRQTLPLKYPLPEVIIVHEDDAVLRDVDYLKTYIAQELNVRKVSVTTDKTRFGVTVKAAPDQKLLGIRLKKKYGDVAKLVNALTEEQVNKLQADGSMSLGGEVIDKSEVRITYSTSDLSGASGNYHLIADGPLLVILDCTKDDSSESEGLAREVTNRIQKLRKKTGLQPHDNITVHYKTSSPLTEVISTYLEMIYSSVQQPITDKPSNETVIISECSNIKGTDLHLTFTRRGSRAAPTKQSDIKHCTVVSNSDNLNIILENPVGSGNLLTVGQLYCLVRNWLKLGSITLYSNGEALTSVSDIGSLNKKTLSTKPDASATTSCNQPNITIQERSYGCYAVVQ